MKKIRFLVAMLAFTAFATSIAVAEDISEERKPIVYLLAVDEGSEPVPTSQAEEAMMNREAVECAKIKFKEHYRTGFQQVQPPTIMFTDRNNKFSIGIGGYIAMRVGYDFKGSPSSTDFIPYDISVPSNSLDQTGLAMDLTTSRLFVKALFNTRTLGTVEVFIDGDYRGGSEGNYRPRVRSAYVSMKGLLFGRDFTTFCDLDAGPRTIDFQGPNAYNANFATMLRYVYTCANDHLTLGIAAEYPQLSGAYGSDYEAVTQRVPDFPMYAQYEWGEERKSHFRASAVLRNPYMYSNITDEATSIFAWGTQASGRISTSWFDILFNGVYGKGIGQYIQDLTGAGLDFTPYPNGSSQLQATPMWGVQGSIAWKMTERIEMNGGYSTVSVDSENGGYYYGDSGYKRGQYVFGNVFCDITPRFNIGAEYLYGCRKNVGGESSQANRVNVLMQYSF
ncbi:MAG: DcaP family trimeric outer membrane transporter [Rikenellaceae bacterium]